MIRRFDRGGTWGDLVGDVWVRAVARELVAEQVQADGSLVELWRTEDIGEAPMFHRSAADAHGRTVSIAKGHDSGAALLIEPGRPTRPIGITHGNTPCAIWWTGQTLVATWIAPGGIRASIRLDTGEEWAQELSARYIDTSRGILDIGPDGSVILADARPVIDVREWSLAKPNVRQGVIVGQWGIAGRTDFDRLCLAVQDQVFTALEGFADDPHLTVLPSGRILVCAFTRRGATLLIIDPPYPPHERPPSVPPIDLPPTHEPPHVTIRAYEPASGFAPLRVRAVTDLTGGPADRLVWLQRLQGSQDWQIAAVNDPTDPDHTFVFATPGTWEIGVRAEGPEGSDETAVARRVVVASALIPDPEPSPMPRPDRVWFCPNIGSQDLLQLFTEDERWTRARAHVGVFQFYAQQILDVGGPVGPNTYQHLVEAHAFRKLREWGIAVAVEMGSVKEGAPWECDASANRARLSDIQMRIRQAGGELTYVAMDEPLTAAPKCQQSLEQTADYVADFINIGEVLGLTVGWIEAWPHVPFETQRKFLALLDARGARPAFVHLDIGRYDTSHPFTGAIVDAFLEATEDDRRIPLGIILNGDTTKPYRASALEWADAVARIDDQWSHLKIQAFPIGATPNDAIVPHNGPESDPTSHAAILNDIVEMFR